MSDGLIIKVLATQIPMFWESVKYACAQADEIQRENYPEYLNELLHALLSDKAQCFVRLDENRILTAIMTTRIMTNKINKKRYLFIQCLYSHKMVSDSIWEKDWDFIKAFAKSENCSYISFDSGNKRLFELTQKLGFVEKFRTYHYQLGEM